MCTLEVLLRRAARREIINKSRPEKRNETWSESGFGEKIITQTSDIIVRATRFFFLHSTDRKISCETTTKNIELDPVSGVLWLRWYFRCFHLSCETWCVGGGCARDSWTRKGTILCVACCDAMLSGSRDIVRIWCWKLYIIVNSTWKLFRQSF